MRISNKKFRAAMRQAGLEKIELCKDAGQFYIYSDDQDTEDKIARLPSSSITVYKFSDMIDGRVGGSNKRIIKTVTR